MRPTLKEAILLVMGDEAHSAQWVYESLKARGWLPNSNNPRAYIGFSMSTMLKDLVTTEERGVYRVFKRAPAPPPPDHSQEWLGQVMREA